VNLTGSLARLLFRTRRLTVKATRRKRRRLRRALTFRLAVAADPTTKRTDKEVVVSKPTQRQLSYLKALAIKTGTSFAYPSTRQEASKTIREMKARLASTDRRIERNLEHVERREIAATANSFHERTTAFADDEIVGYGASATWAHGA
jgi:hypothetical protein